MSEYLWMEGEGGVGWSIIKYESRKLRGERR